MTSVQHVPPRGQHQRHQQRQQRQQRQQNPADLAQEAAFYAAYVADALATRARRLPSACAAQLATDALTVAIAADVWDALEGGLAA